MAWGFWLQAGLQAEKGEGPLLQRSGLGDLLEAGLAALESEAVLGQGGELVEQSREAVYEGAFREALSLRLPLGLRGALCRRHRVFGPGLVLVAEEQRSPGPLQVPAHVVGEHAKEDVSSHPPLQPVPDGPHLEVD